ncbi:coiled-coil domain-containing 92B [Syngnathus scovelli]|uniref:coiled-coil domain-containing 92B n=1 Tax=Syngnathus scovelli TaxID=161590 RepID=UPI00210FE601|nr:coiled-coil domain-containing protein 92 [Syngnathus scovelli]
MEASSELEHHVASVHRAIVFLEQEHLTLLAGLHVEISNLKRRCQELSCELDSRFPHRTTAADLASRCKVAQRLLEEQHGSAATARGELRLGGARASELGRNLRRDERHFLDELKRRSHKISLLNRELQLQKGAAAALFRQLNAARAKLRQQRGARQQGEPLAPQDQDEDEGEDDEQLPSPLLTRASVRAERVRACVPQERVTSPQKPHPMPDPALFLVPLRYRLLLRGGEADDWEDVDEGGGLRGRVDMGAAEGETAL